jgi:eukaryotic-like serine/threonine-protein kinase
LTSDDDKPISPIAQTVDATAANDTLVGTTLGHYRIVAKLGQGGMGVVYRAEDEKLRRAVALKVLPDTSGNEERRQRFLREARSAAAIAHPNVAVVHQVDEAGGRIYIAMELVDGENLRAKMDRGHLDLPTARDLALQIARGLAAAHDKGIVHRDLKPENIMITAAGVVKLLDFGLAKSAVAAEGNTSGRAEVEGARTETLVTSDEGRIMGTPQYMSPEQAVGEPLDVRSDVFSFGIVLYEMLSGSRPFEGANTGAVLVAIARDPVQPLRTRAPGVDGSIAAIVMRCLEKRREARFASGSELVAALTSVARGPQFADVSRKRGRSLGIPGVVLGAVVILAAALVWGGRPRTSAAPIAAAPSSAAGASAPAPSTSVVRWSDLAPSPADPRAAAKYRSGMELRGRGELAAANRAIEEAIGLDPDFASAHLQRFVSATELCPTDLAVARPHYQAASHARLALSERDRDVLDAMAPAVLDPPDLGEVAVRLRALATRRPDDVQVVQLLAVAENKLFRFDASAIQARRAMALDPDEATPDGPLILDQDLDSKEGRQVLQECVRRFPAAQACRTELAARLETDGACADLEADARALMTLDPDLKRGPYVLVDALAGKGASTEALRLALDQAEEHLPRESVAASKARDDALLAAWDGDFGAAIAVLEAAQVARLPMTGTVPTVLLYVELLREAGLAKRAGEAALAYVKQAPALPRIERPETDPLPAMLARAHAARVLSDADFQTQRDAWIDTWRRRLDDEAWKTGGPVVWALAFSRPADEAGARDAVQRLPSFGTMLPPIASRRFWTDDGLFGELLLRGGRVDDALPRLKVAAARCELGPGPIQARLRLGEALEQTGDHSGACAAYASVLARWGHAKPRSITADEAHAHAMKLGCAL